MTATADDIVRTMSPTASAEPRPARHGEDLVELAAGCAGAPYAGIRLVCGGASHSGASHGFDPATPPPVAEQIDRTLRAGALVEAPDVPGLSLYAGVPIRNSRGDDLGVLWIADDRPRPPLAPHVGRLLAVLAEQVALRASHRDMLIERRTALRMTSAVVFHATVEGTVTEISSSWTTLTGRSAETTVGLPLAELVHAHGGETIGAVLAGCTPGTVRRVDCTVTTLDGTAVPAELALSCLDRDGQIGCHVLGVVTDLRERQRREVELRHDQKLESLGRLSAGIAHEINTPIQFVGDNTRFLAEACQEMLDLVLAYRECMDSAQGEIPWEERLARATAAEAEADVDYLAAEVPVAVAQSLQGIERVASLVRAMKSFSFKESNDRTYADLNEALETTLTVARSEIKYVADVVLDLGELPEVLCHLGDLNQVFLNLLVNAADALHEKGERGEIRVTTRTEGAFAVVSVADNGPGIPEELHQTIFEPFFTTKEVGKGTGQGLALARAVVVDKHGGTIELHSAPGKGTEFVLRLPVDGKLVAAG
ncbi:MAG TPA: PAS domain-containing sensor histidine kinase [Mycobacteriales bacterium]